MRTRIALVLLLLVLSVGSSNRCGDGVTAFIISLEPTSSCASRRRRAAGEASTRAGTRACASTPRRRGARARARARFLAHARRRSPRAVLTRARARARARRAATARALNMSEAAVHAIVDHMLFPQPIPQSARAGGSARRPPRARGHGGAASRTRRVAPAARRAAAARRRAHPRGGRAALGSGRRRRGLAVVLRRVGPPAAPGLAVPALEPDPARARGGCCDAAAAAAPAAPGTAAVHRGLVARHVLRLRRVLRQPRRRRGAVRAARAGLYTTSRRSSPTARGASARASASVRARPSLSRPPTTSLRRLKPRSRARSPQTRRGGRDISTSAGSSRRISRAGPRVKRPIVYRRGGTGSAGSRVPAIECPAKFTRAPIPRAVICRERWSCSTSGLYS